MVDYHDTGSRDLAILGGGTFILQRSAYITTSNQARKRSTVVLTLALLCHMLGIQPLARRLFYLTLAPLSLSWIQYAKRFRALR